MESLVLDKFEMSVRHPEPRNEAVVRAGDESIVPSSGSQASEMLLA